MVALLLLTQGGVPKNFYNQWKGEVEGGWCIGSTRLQSSRLIELDFSEKILELQQLRMTQGGAGKNCLHPLKGLEEGGSVH